MNNNLNNLLQRETQKGTKYVSLRLDDDDGLASTFLENLNKYVQINFSIFLVI